MEKIGKVELDDTFYGGTDLYSDGEIEDKLLRIAQNYTEEELNQVIVQENSWPVLYHFSNIRKNIIEWIPISKSEKVLEVGSGCGAITGALARKAERVDCIELSKKRSMINAYRNREYENIKIIMGNFQDIEPNLNSDYDYITLIGVFEYSQGYIKEEEPYIGMLESLKRHLAPGGKIVIAIENRLGLKYWAGCTEDHVGRYFEGLEGYHNAKGVRTFSKKEWEKLIKVSGMRGKFYYPYPDYKFPLSIYSDEYLPRKGELNLNSYNFDRKRITLFDEGKVYDSLIEEDMFPMYSNSFLILLERN